MRSRVLRPLLKIPLRCCPLRQKVGQVFDRILKQRGRSEAVRGRVEDLSENESDPRPIMQEFWDSTFPALGDKGKRAFLAQMKFQMGMQPGDTLVVNKDGSHVAAQDWRDITDTFFKDTKNVDDLEQNAQAVVGLADIINGM